MKSRWLEQAMITSRLARPTFFPRDLEGEVTLALPLTIVSESALSVFRVRAWLQRVGVRHQVAKRDRALHGCLTARAGVGIIFLEANDPADERRFTLAHEIAHFLLDHLLPRQRAIRVFGEVIRPVLDGVRPPTKEEALHSVLKRTPLGVQVHLMGRGTKGEICAWSVEDAEQRADRLALEIAAPTASVLETIRARTDDATSVPVTQATTIITGAFGLPTSAAAAYAEVLFGKQRKRRSVLDLIGNV